MEKIHRLAILISHPIQYHVPIFQALHKDPRVDLTVYYKWDFGVGEERVEPEFGVKYKWDIPMLDGYKYKFLRNISFKPSSTSFWGQINPSIIGELRREKYDGLMVHGYQFLTDWLAFFSARSVKTPIFLRGITHILDERPWHVRLAKRIIFPFLFRMMSVCLYIGKHNKLYYKAYGVSDEKLIHVPHVVNNAFFREFEENSKSRREEFKKEFGIPANKPIIVSLGKLIPKKQPMWTLRAYDKVRRDHDCALLYVGDGPLRGEIEEYIKGNSIQDVTITGFLNYSDVPKGFFVGDIFVLPSAWGETWGLVINEAMNLGLPIIISDKVGCSGNLVQGDKNGYVIHSFDEFVDAMRSLVSNEELRSKFSEGSREIISKWGIPEAVEGIIEALEAEK